MEIRNRNGLSRELIWEYALLILIFVLGIILFRQAQAFMSGVLGAFALYILLRNVSFRLTEKIHRPTLSATIIVICVMMSMND